MAEVVVLEIDVSSIAKGLADAQTQLEIYKRGMEDAIEQNGRFSEAANLAAAQVQAQAKEVKQVEGALLRLTQAEKALGGSVNDLVKTYDASNKSIDQNRKVLNALTAEYVKTANPSKEFTARIKNISDTLKQQEGVIGDTRRNVGNYFNEFAKGIPVLGQAVSGVQNMGLAFKSAGGGVQGFSAALATTGLPLIIAGVTALIDVFKTFTPIAEAVEDATNAMGAAFNAIVTGGNISEAIRLTQEYTDAVRDLEDTQASFNLSQQGYLNQIDALIIKSKDRTKTEKERLEALKEAGKLDKILLAESTKRVDIEFEKLKKSVAGKAQLREDELEDFIYGTEQQVLYYDKLLDRNKAVDKKDVARLQALALEKAKLLGESRTLQERLINRENQLTDEITKENETRLQKQKEADAKLAEQKKKYLENLQKLEDEFNLDERQKLAKTFDDKIATIIGQGERETDLRFTILQAREAALAKFDQDRLDARKKAEDEMVASNAAALSKIFAQNSTSAKEQIKLDKETSEQKKAIQQAEVSFAKTVSSSLISFISNIAEASGASAAFNKTLALVEIATQTAIALVTGIASSQDLPYPGNLIAMGTTIASVLTSIGQAVNIINNSPNPAKPSFALGGQVVDIDGKPHSQGGTPIHVNGQYVAEAEAGEGLFIMKKDAYQAGKLSKWNQLYGGKSWGVDSGRFAALGGALRFSDGGFTARETVRQSDSMAFMSAAIREGFANAPAPKLSIVELENKQASRNRSISISEA